MSTAVGAGPLLARAEEKAGIEAEPDLAERFAALVDSFEKQAGTLGDPARETARSRLVSVLATRLGLDADLRRFPDIAAERIERPVFVVGFARTGTTLLHYLLASDPGCRAPQLWETRFPSPPPGLGGADERMALGDEDVRQWCDLVPGMLAAHPYFDKGGSVFIEDEEIMALDFDSAYPTWYPDVPMLLEGTAASDPARGYAFHHRFLQQLQYGRPTGHWACKGTAHQFSLPALWERYPDALCVWAHRRPAETYGSTLELAACCNQGILGHVDRPALGTVMLDAVRAGLDHVLASDVADDPRLVHLRYTDLVADPIGCVRTVYERGDRRFPPGYEQRMRSWLDDPANAGHRHGRFQYDLKDFGLSDDAVDRRFADYTERFLAPSGAGAPA